MAWASDSAPLLVIWSPWVTGLNVSSSLCSGPSLHLLSLRTCQFLFYIFPHFSQDNAWDYDPATQVWGCRDSGGCSYYCHWGGSGKAPHLSGNASSDSTNTSPPSPIFPVFSLALLHSHSRGAFSYRGLKSITAPVFPRTPICIYVEICDMNCLHGLSPYIRIKTKEIVIWQACIQTDRNGLSKESTHVHYKAVMLTQRFMTRRCSVWIQSRSPPFIF